MKNFFYFLIILIIIWIDFLRANTDYTEFYFGDASTPLVALGQEFLSSNDMIECSASNTAHINPHAFLRSLGLYPLDQKQRQTVTPSRQNQTFDNLLIGFPITALSQRMAIGAVTTHVVIPPRLASRPARNLANYKFGKMKIKELKPKLIASEEGRCLLSFDFCLHRWNCHSNRFRPFLQIPILGISKKHQALIFDSNQLGVSLKETQRLAEVNPLRRSRAYEGRALGLRDPKTSIVDFSNSSLIFDVDAQVGWRKVNPRPQITQRWFLKFDLVSSEEGFASRPPTKGVGYYLNIYEALQKASFQMSKRIARHRIFKNGQIKPIKYYVKNVPTEYQLAFQQAFEYWQSIFTSFISHPILTYEFIQGDFDQNGQEIVTGDLRFNVVEWNQSFLETVRGRSFKLLNQHTGEIWSSNVIIYGNRLVDEYQKWFQYNNFIRENTPSLSRNNFHSASYLNQFTDILQTSFQPFSFPTPPNEIFESYFIGFMTNLVSHEIGHNLGLEHNYKGNLFGDETYSANTQMDILGFHQYKPVSNGYDKMTIGYGYLGIPPYRTDMFCGDANLINNYYWDFSIENLSPECIKFDSTSKPLEHATWELRQIVNLITTKLPFQDVPYFIWNYGVEGFISFLLRIYILPYYILADTHYNRLQSISINGRRPQNPQEVKDIVLNILKAFTCDPVLLDLLNQKEPTHPQLQRNVMRFFNTFYNAITTRTDIAISDLRCS